jgi:hypothetical protein
LDDSLTRDNGVVAYWKGRLRFMMDAGIIPTPPDHSSLPPELVFNVYNNGNITNDNHAGKFSLPLKSWSRKSDGVFYVEAGFPGDKMDLSSKDQNEAYPGKGYQLTLNPAPEGTALSLMAPNTAQGQTLLNAAPSNQHFLATKVAAAAGLAAVGLGVLPQIAV